MAVRGGVEDSEIVTVAVDIDDEAAERCKVASTATKV